MTEQEIVASNTQLVFAGNETTAKLLAQIVATLAVPPDQRRLLHADRTLALDTVEEVHRLETVTHSIFRDVVGQSATVGNAVLGSGERITLLQERPTAIHDAGARPDELDITRRKLSHLGFAFGLHSCLGMNLARLEAQIFVEELVEEVRDWQLAGPLDYGTNYTVRAVQAGCWWPWTETSAGTGDSALQPQRPGRALSYRCDLQPFSIILRVIVTVNATMPASETSNTSSAIDSQMPCPVHLPRSTSTRIVAPIYAMRAGTRLMPCTKLL